MSGVVVSGGGEMVREDKAVMIAISPVAGETGCGGNGARGKRGASARRRFAPDASVAGSGGFQSTIAMLRTWPQSDITS
jgi:hypothetical protein